MDPEPREPDDADALAAELEREWLEMVTDLGQGD